MAERLLYVPWLERETHNLTVGPKWAALAPGSPVFIEMNGAPVRCRVLQIDDAAFGQRKITAVTDHNDGQGTGTGPMI